MIASIAFYLFAALTILPALAVIFARNPVHSVLWLILAFFNAAGLFVLTPMTLLNAPSGYSDAAFGGSVVALAASAALFSLESTAVTAVCTGMAAAHVLSLKGTGIAFVCVTGGALALVTRLKSPSGLGLAALVAVPGLFWALRNVVHTGNPLWPVEIQVSGRIVFPGVAPLERILDVAHNTPPALPIVSACSGARRAVGCDARS